MSFFNARTSFEYGMDAFLYSTLGVLIAEIGDKTQLLTLFLAARFRQTHVILMAIMVATLLNHAVSALLGVWLTQTISPDIMKFIVGISFIAVGLWLLIPDKTDDEENNRWIKYGAFTATFILFFLAEIGDKTQIATVLLAAKYQSMFAVVIGSVLGLMLANIPIAYCGERIMRKIPACTVRYIACVVFCLLGMMTLLSKGIVLSS